MQSFAFVGLRKAAKESIFLKYVKIISDAQKFKNVQKDIPKDVRSFPQRKNVDSRRIVNILMKGAITMMIKRCYRRK